MTILYTADSHANCLCTTRMIATNRELFPVGTTLPCQLCLTPAQPSSGGKPCCCTCLQVNWPGIPDYFAANCGPPIIGSDPVTFAMYPQPYAYGSGCGGYALGEVTKACLVYDSYYGTFTASLWLDVDSHDKTTYYLQITIPCCNAAAQFGGSIVALYSCDGVHFNCDLGGTFEKISDSNTCLCQGSFTLPGSLEMSPDPTCGTSVTRGSCGNLDGVTHLRLDLVAGAVPLFYGTQYVIAYDGVSTNWPLSCEFHSNALNSSGNACGAGSHCPTSWSLPWNPGGGQGGAASVWTVDQYGFSTYIQIFCVQKCGQPPQFEINAGGDTGGNATVYAPIQNGVVFTLLAADSLGGGQGVAGCGATIMKISW